MTSEDLDKLINDPKTWIVKDFNENQTITYKVSDLVVSKTPEGNFGVYILIKPSNIYKKWLALGQDRNVHKICENDFVNKDNEELFNHIKVLIDYLKKN